MGIPSLCKVTVFDFLYSNIAFHSVTVLLLHLYGVSSPPRSLAGFVGFIVASVLFCWTNKQDMSELVRMFIASTTAGIVEGLSSANDNLIVPFIHISFFL